jgi:hypothetical protein
VELLGFHFKTSGRFARPSLASSIVCLVFALSPLSRVREFGLVSVSDREPTDKAGDSPEQHSECQSVRVLRSFDFALAVGPLIL